MSKGDSVRITISAGLMEHPMDTRFVGKCEPGTVGEYVGPHPNKKLAHWHVIKVGELVAPLGPNQFEAAP